MTIKKYAAASKDEAIAQAKRELGDDCEIMNVDEKKSGGFLGFGKKVTYEITAMIDKDIVSPKDIASDNMSVSKRADDKHSRFSAVADQQIVMPVIPPKKNNDSQEELEITKQQFAKLSQIFRDNENKTKPGFEVESINDKDSNIISKRDVDTDKNASSAEQNNNDTMQEANNVLSGNNHRFVRTLYTTLLNNDIDERYINQLLYDMEKVLKNGNNVNYLISNVYQKMILKLGQPSTIKLAKKGPKVVFFIGSTGVGKTTTIAKIASEFKMEKKVDVAFVTIDTYRLKATDQLGEYASIMKIPMSVIYEPDELTDKVDKLKSYDLILVDTSGFSHKNEKMRENVINLVNNLNDKYEKEVYLVLSSTTKYNDLKEIIDSYKEFTDFNIIFTKLDETITLGNIYNCKLYSNKNLSYVTNGQNVPNDIELLDTQKLIKQLLKGE